MNTFHEIGMINQRQRGGAKPVAFPTGSWVNMTHGLLWILKPHDTNVQINQKPTHGFTVDTVITVKLSFLHRETQRKGDVEILQCTYSRKLLH